MALLNGENKEERNPRSRAWHYVINNYTDDDIEGVIAIKDFVYHVFGFEVGENGTPHIQAYVCFENQRFRHAMKKLLPRAKLLVARGSAKQNFTYNSKDGEYYEQGKIEESAGPGKPTFQKLQIVMNNPEQNPHVFMQYHRAYPKMLQVIAERGRSLPDSPPRILCTQFYDPELLLDMAEKRFKFSTPFFTEGNETDCWNNEQLVITDCYGMTVMGIAAWMRKRPYTIRRGFDLIKFDPDIICMTYKSEQGRAYIRKTFSKYIDKELCQDLRRDRDDAGCVVPEVENLGNER